MVYIFLILLLFPLAPKASSETLTFGYSEACPHMCPNDENKGFTADITKEVLEKFGHKVKFVAQPWGRAVKNANEGKLTGIICTGKEESPLLVYPELEHGLQDDCFYGRKEDNWQPKGPFSFESRKTIIFKGWVYEKEYKEKFGLKKYFEIFREFSLDNNYIPRGLELVTQNRIDAFWNDATVYTYFIKQNNLEEKTKNIKQLGCIRQQKLYMGISPKFKKLAKKLTKQFDAGMKELRQSGGVEKIMAKYGLRDWRASGSL